VLLFACRDNKETIYLFSLRRDCSLQVLSTLTPTKPASKKIIEFSCPYDFMFWLPPKTDKHGDRARLPGRLAFAL